jgi:hypothetical protein
LPRWAGKSGFSITKVEDVSRRELAGRALVWSWARLLRRSATTATKTSTAPTLALTPTIKGRLPAEELAAGSGGVGATTGAVEGVVAVKAADAALDVAVVAVDVVGRFTVAAVAVWVEAEGVAAAVVAGVVVITKTVVVGTGARLAVVVPFEQGAIAKTCASIRETHSGP